ncbi:MAG: hypothetical protein HY898_05665 [Deltaproteobacteria bacterium]|nr:hypothetical protein [Deltaproteobacteria bacterium]
MSASFCFGALAATFGTVTTGGCGAADAEDSAMESRGGSSGAGGGAAETSVPDDAQTTKEAEPPESRENLTLAFVHASANLWPFRLCLRSVESGEFYDTEPLPSDPDAVMPHSNKIGVAPGSALVLRHAETTIGYGSVTVEPTLVRVDRLQGKSGLKCSQLVCTESGAHCLLAEDYVTLPSIPIASSLGDAAAIFAIHGCLGGANATAERCGGDPGTAGNLAIKAFETFALPTEELSSGTVRVRAAHFSESADVVLAGSGADSGDSGKLVLQYGKLASPELGVTLLNGDPFLSVVPAMGSLVIVVPGTTSADLPKYQEQGFTLLAPSQDAGTSQVLTLSLAAVQDLSDTSSVPNKFWNSATDFLVALVGDATQDASQLQVDGGENPFFDGYGLHLIAIPLRLREQADAGTEP